MNVFRFGGSVSNLLVKCAYEQVKHVPIRESVPSFTHRRMHLNLKSIYVVATQQSLFHLQAHVDSYITIFGYY